MKFHPIADIFPLLSDEDRASLATDIKEHGQRDPILLFQGKVLDGRNRYLACEAVGIKPKARKFSGTAKDAIKFVWSTNFHRRHLTSGQAAMAIAVRKKLDPDFVTEVIRPIQEEAKKRQLSAGIHGTEGGRGKKKTLGKFYSQGFYRNSRRAATIIAKTHGTNRIAVGICDKILTEQPEFAAAIMAGEMSVTQARRELQRNEVKRGVAAMPVDKYRVIYADPPWKYGDQLTENYGATQFHYPSMSIPELCALPVGKLAFDNSVLFLWVTSPILPECFEVIRAWGFEYKASFVWDKVRHNMGHYNSVRHEFLLICTRGSCLPDSDKLIDSVQSIERTAKHSEKPEQFRKIIERMYPKGKRIELFARTEVKGWERWGNEPTAVV